MDLASGYSDQFNYGNGYTPDANAAIANNNSEYARNQATIALMGQQAIDQHNADWARTNPATDYGHVGGYPTFGDPAPAGTYSPGSGLSSFSGTPLSPGGGGASVFDTGTTPFNTYNQPYGGTEDIDWMKGGSQGPRPSTVPDWGGGADQAWYGGGAQGARPSTLYDSKNTWGGIYDQDWVKGGSEGVRPSTVAGWGNTEDQDWVYKHGSQGPRPSTVADWGGGADQAWYGHGSEGIRPSLGNYYDKLASNDPDGLVGRFYANEKQKLEKGGLSPTGEIANNPYAHPPGADLSNPASYWWPSADTKNQYELTREPYTSQLANDPARMYDMAVRLSLELSNRQDTQGRQGIAEAMFNRYATQTPEVGLADPLVPEYYPVDQAYKDLYARQTRELKNDPAFLAQLYGEIGLAARGSNISNDATDWASGRIAADSAKTSTETWKSPIEGERFFRKDISNSKTGAGVAQKVQDWYRAMQEGRPY